MDLTPRALTAAEFSPYGDIVGTQSARAVFKVNDGRAERFAHLALQQSVAPACKQELSLYRLNPSTLPLDVSYFERHPLTTQIFYPLCAARYLVLVCPSAADGSPDAARAQAWVAPAGLGINYHPGVWHYPLVALDEGGDFLMLMAEGAGAQDCEISALATPMRVGCLPAP